MKHIIFAASTSLALLGAPAALADQGNTMTQQTSQQSYEEAKEQARQALLKRMRQFDRDLNALSKDKDEFVARHPDANRVGLGPESADEFRKLMRRQQELVERMDAIEHERLEFNRRYIQGN